MGGGATPPCRSGCAQPDGRGGAENRGGSVFDCGRPPPTGGHSHCGSRALALRAAVTLRSAVVAAIVLPPSFEFRVLARDRFDDDGRRGNEILAEITADRLTRQSCRAECLTED